MPIYGKMTTIFGILTLMRLIKFMPDFLKAIFYLPGEPDDDSPDKSGGADCAAMIGSDNLRWRSRHCELSYKFICEYNPESD